MSNEAGEPAVDPGGQATDGVAGNGPPLEVQVLNADIRYQTQALLIGHYRSAILAGTEAVMDGLLGGVMSQAMAAGLYPSVVGAHHIFGHVAGLGEDAAAAGQRPAVMVAGLGGEGDLRPADLVYTIRAALLAFSQRLYEQGCAPGTTFALAATLLGSGGTDISAGFSAQALVQAAFEANTRIAQLAGWPRLGQLTLIELFLERASEAWHALSAQQELDPKLLTLNGKVRTGQGALRRAQDAGYRGSSYDLISASRYMAPGESQPGIFYKLDTRRARAEIHAHRAQANLLREFARPARSAEIEREIGTTLFNLLIPIEMEPFLTGSNEMVIELDASTAGIPWELLDSGARNHASDKRPWAIRCQLIRKLQIRDFRIAPRDADTQDKVLVIGNPKTPSEHYPSLEGAQEEAMAVAELLNHEKGGLPRQQVILLGDQNDAQSILIALFKEPYRIVHIAGHGELGPDGGVVLSSPNTFLGANEVSAMRSIPELVFINCCYLAGRDSNSILEIYDRPAFAANIADALIRIGVRCVVAAGWAVNDRLAKLFAVTFYEALFNGRRFIEAVGAAREKTWKADPQSNTWAAYQCYGDPNWRWQRSGISGARSPKRTPKEEVGAIASPESLLVVLETITVQASNASVNKDAFLARLKYLDSEYADIWGDMGMIANAFGVAYAALAQVDQAISWYQRALGAPDGQAPLQAAKGLKTQLEIRAQAPPGGEPADNTAEVKKLVAKAISAQLAQRNP